MHVVALEAQQVRMRGHRWHFAAGETIHTENSYKYSLDEFRALAARAGFESARLWTDRRRLFALHGLVRT
jgi:uncharacterized SAM-dependent methyltransferase